MPREKKPIIIIYRIIKNRGQEQKQKEKKERQKERLIASQQSKYQFVCERKKIERKKKSIFSLSKNLIRQKERRIGGVMQKCVQLAKF